MRRPRSQTRLEGRRVTLRPLDPRDFEVWREVRLRNAEWLTRWEPRRLPGQADVIENRDAFAARCAARSREWQLGTGYGFGVFTENDAFAGEMNLSSVQRGPFQNAYVGYWIDEKFAGQSYTPEALVVTARYAFEQLSLHRLQIAIIPRNGASRRVVEKLGLREEGVALRYLEINGVWEDHIRYAITAEEWESRKDEFGAQWF